MVFLKDITINLDNKRKPLNDNERKALKGKNLYPYCGANGILDYIDEYIFDQEILCIAEDGGSWGYKENCCYLMNEPCWVNNHAHVLVPKNNVNIKYLYYYLNYVDLNKYITGTTRGKLTKSALEKIQVLLPSLADQNKIVDLLDKAQELIDKRKAQIEALDQLTQSVFLEMFGDPIYNTKNWETVSFDNVVILQRGYDLPVNKRNLEGNVEVYGSNGVLSFHDEAKVTGGGIITGRSGSIGNVYYTFDDFWPLNTTLFSKETFGNNIIYLKYLLKKFKLERFVNGTGVPTLNRNIVHKEQIINVPIDLQNKFARTVIDIEKQKEKLENSLSDFDNLFNAFMQRAFKGELFTEEKVSNL